MVICQFQSKNMLEVWRIPGHVLVCSILILFIARVSYSACPPDDVVTYEVIPEDQYDRNYSSIGSDGKRPLGFMKATWSYNQNNPNPCILLKDTSGRRVEIMVEAIPAAKICVNVGGPQTQYCSDPGSGQMYQCVKTLSSNVYLEFVGDDAGESDIQFWYRLVLGPLPADDTEDRWCDDHHRDRYPSSLRTLPDGYSLNLEPTNPSNGGTITTIPQSLFVSLLPLSVSLIKYLN
ncbi:unnamed protein product [Lymnaea stagnalis]|uniref:Uncharacterized protein n=1 Tax=Lymnaea stagnalis TaxID=6523 RepID=A0AAV2HGV1_LYMST